MSEGPPGADFKSPEEFAALMRYLTLRLHTINRVGMGESKFAWHVAEVARALGEEFSEGLRDREVQHTFGDGYSKGQLVSHEERVDALFARLRARLVPR